MSNDIGEDILKAIRSGMAQEVGGKGKIAEIIAKAENGKANFNDVSDLSTQLGNALSRLIAVNVTPDKLPNGRLYYNIADTFLTSSLRDNYDLLNVTAQAVQESTDNKSGIKIEPQKAEFPAERVNAIVNAVSDETADWSTISRRLDSPVRNVTESFYNDYVEANAEFRSNAGLKSHIIRETDGNCCAWCSSLAGQYEYPNDVPPDVYARHDNCTCTVTYVTDKYKQNVWSKKRYALSADERKKILENTPKPERFTREQGKAVEKANLNGAVGVANSGKSGIINEDSKKPITKITDSAIEKVPEFSITGYTAEQCAYIREQHRELLRYARDNNNGNEVAFVFNNDLSSRREFTGSDDKIDFGSSLFGKDLILLHNHPRNSSYSLNDVVEFVGNNSIKTITIVKNNGKVETLTKTGEYNRLSLLKELQRLEKNSVKTGSDSEYRKIVDKFLNKYTEGGAFEWLK